MNKFYRYGVPHSTELYHHGVKGMKWGVTKNVATGVSNAASSSSGIINSVSNISKTASSKKYDNSLSQMSDQELNKRLNRLNMEKNYKTLLSEKRTSRGATYAKEALSIVGNVAAITASVATTAIAVKKLMNK